MFNKGDILIKRIDNSKIELRNIITYNGQVWYKDYTNARYVISTDIGYTILSFEDLIELVFTPEEVRNNTINDILS